MSVDYTQLAINLATKNSSSEDIHNFTKELLNQCSQSSIGVENTLTALRSVITQENAGIVQKQLFSDMVDGLKPPLSNEVIKNVAIGIISMLSTRAIAYEDLIRKLKLILADIYERENNYVEAANILLQSLHEGTFVRSLSPNESAKALLNLAEICLKANKLDDAEQVVTRVSMMQHELSSELVARYNFFYATTLDKRGKFVEAASKYYDLSVSPYVIPDERKNMIQKCVICVILSTESPLRQRLLSSLFHDERCRKIIGYNIIEKMYLNRLITPKDAIEFESLLQPHQRSQGKDSYLQRFTLEHNVNALSKIFKNVSFQKMATLLNTDVNTVEKTAEEMITGGRLEASLDQSKSMISFKRCQEKQSLEQYFGAACQEANNVFERIVKEYPEWYANKFPATAN